MALLPYLEEEHRLSEFFPSWRHYDDFAIGLPQQEWKDFITFPSRLMRSLLDFHQYPISPRFGRWHGGLYDVRVGKDGFEVILDVHQYTKSDLSVKTVDNTIIIEGKHNEKDDPHGHMCRSFLKRYTIPIGYDSRLVTSSISSDGFLTVRAPAMCRAQIKGRERNIYIHRTGPSNYLSIRDC